MKLQNDKKRKPAVMKRNPDLKKVKELNAVLDAILSTKQLEMLMEEIEKTVEDRKDNRNN